MPRMSKIELFAAIRRDLAAGMSGRTIEEKYRVGRRTVSAAAVSALPPPRKALPSRGSKLDPFKPAIDDILRADLDAPRKQRHTVRRIYHRLLDEHGMADISYQVVRTYVADRKPKIRAEAGRGPIKMFFPQTHQPGAEAEVDFGEIVINLRGEPVTCMLFSFRMSFSGKAIHRIFASGGHKAFFEGHVHALKRLGGVPTGRVRYDNLRSAVAKVLGFSGNASRPSAGPHSARTTAWTFSTASQASKAHTRKAASRARSAGSAATTSSRSRASTHLISSTP